MLIVFQAACGGMTGEPAKGPAQESSGAATTPIVQVTRVVSQKLDRSIRLPGELAAYQDVALYAKVQGFVESIPVDRGSVVKKAQLLVKLIAPELGAQRSAASARAAAEQSQLNEAEAKLQSLRAQRAEAESKLASDDATHQHLKAAAVTPGVVAGNELEISQKTVEADQSRVRASIENEKAGEAHIRALRENEQAARDAARSVEDMEAYLRVMAPFDGIVTERNVHEGSLVGSPGASGGLPMLRLQQVSRLRLTVYVPESEVAGIATGSRIPFAVPAFPAQSFSGTLSRVARSLDVKTRTMPVELDVQNTTGHLAPGMYAEVVWPSRRSEPSLFVPPSAIATTTERSFVLRIENGAVAWVDVKRGATMGNLVEIFGDLKAGDWIAIRGTDELRDGTRVTTKQSSATGK